MPRYLVEVKQILGGTVVVEAENEEDTLETAEYWIKDIEVPKTKDDLDVIVLFEVEGVICRCD